MTKSIKKNILLTSLTALLSQLTSVITAILLPRLLIIYFGSDLNGVVSAARQFTSYLTMIDSGLYAATCYRFIIAFNNNDLQRINDLFVTAGSFFKRVAYVLTALSTVVIFGYAMLAEGEVNAYLVAYIFIMYALGTIVAYFGYFKYNLVMYSAGEQYKITAVCIFFNLASVLAQYVAIKIGLGIIIAVLIHPLGVICRLVVLKKMTVKSFPYLSVKEGRVDNSLISQKWDSIIMNIADSMKTFAPILCISVFFTFSHVSVFSIYESILHFGSSLLVLSLNGLTPIFGKNLVQCTDESRDQFRKLYTAVILISGIICTCFFSMIGNFMSLYIGNEADVNYIYPMLATLMIINVWLLMVRTSYDLLIKANGYIKELKNGAVIEIAISLVLSFAFAYFLGFEYVPLGIIASSLYRTIRMAIFCVKKLEYGKNIIKDLLLWFVITSVISAICAAITPGINNWLTFILLAAAVFTVTLMLYVICGFVASKALRDYIKVLIKKRA